VQLAADANVLLSAVIGGRARLVLSDPGIQEVFTTEHNLAEVEQYAVELAAKRHLSSDTLLLAIAALPVTVVSRNRYVDSLAEAAKRIAHRDPDDVELLALALHFRIPIWSNDKDFEGLNVALFNTERLLRHLRMIE